MSERSSFTSEYIYYTPDYEAIRKAANEWGNGKSLNFAPPASWADNEMPIISGKVGGLHPRECIFILKEFFDTFEVQRPVTFIIVRDGHNLPKEYRNEIVKMIKKPKCDNPLDCCDEFCEVVEWSETKDLF